MYENEDLYSLYGYTIDVSKWDMTDSERNIVYLASELVDNDWSLSELSKNTGVPKSTLQREFTNKLRYLSYELYQCVQRRYKQHKTYTKG